MNLNQLHQLPDSHPIAQRARISLAHIDTADCLRRNRENFAKAQTKARKAGQAAASALTVGQSVRRKNAGNTVGTVVAIDGTQISVDFGGSVRVFAASFILAA